MPATPTVGLIGLGIMGRSMARNLMSAGSALTVFDVNEAAVAELVADGTTRGASPRGVAAAVSQISDSVSSPAP